MTEPWQRPLLTVTRPNRNPAGIYRSADGEREGTVLAGVPLQTVSDAVVAAVQLGYKVADKQIKRGRRMTAQLGSAASRAGVKSAAEPVEAAERLVSNALQMGLEWIEKAAVEPGGPLRRLARAEYRMLGSMMGLTDGVGGTKPTKGAGPAAAPVAPIAPTPSVPPAPTATSNAASTRLRIKHLPKSVRRVVLVVTDDRPRDAATAGPFEVVFHHAARLDAGSFKATLERNGVLAVTTTREQPGGHWRAAICDADGLQIGSVEIEL